jgi:hypothetical protein
VSGQGIYGGKFNWPAWRRAIAAQTWGVVPSNTLASIDPEDNPAYNPNYPANAPWHAIGGQQAIISAWCGACFDEANSTLWLPLGGGHADYAGNEPYKININAETPTWEMVRSPTGSIGNEGNLDDSQEVTGLYFDGRPRAIHSYNKPVYVPNVGPMLVVQGSTSFSGQSGTGRPILINPTSGEMTNFGTPAPANTGTKSNSAGCYDPLRHCNWFIGSGTAKMAKYDISLDTWTTPGPLLASNGANALVYMQEHDCLLWVCSFFANGFAVYDCDTNTVYQPAISGAFVGVTLSGFCQPVAYSANEYAIWDNDTNTTTINTMYFTSNPRTDVWSIGQLSVAGANATTPSARTGTGTFGRFFYSKKLDGFGVINSVLEPVYFYARS